MSRNLGRLMVEVDNVVVVFPDGVVDKSCRFFLQLHLRFCFQKGEEGRGFSYPPDHTGSEIMNFRLSV